MIITFKWQETYTYNINITMRNRSQLSFITEEFLEVAVIENL